MKRTLIVSPEGEGNRLDTFLSLSEESLSRSAVQKLCEAEIVSRNGSAANKKDLLRAGDRLEYELPEPAAAEAIPENIPVEIIYEDKFLLVVNKPQGMVVHPAPGNYTGTLVNALLFHCEGRLSSINGIIRPGIVHRIDKDTSGLLVVAKDDYTHTALAERFAIHDIERVYDAIICGCPRENEGTVDAPIGRHPIDRKKMFVTSKNSRRAVTHYSVQERFNGYSYIKCRLETGRTHQIRVHMASIGHPVAGDPVYGPAKGISGLHGQCLHAGLLGFVHPVTGKYLRFEVPPPAEFQQFLGKLRRISE